MFYSNRQMKFFNQLRSRVERGTNLANQPTQKKKELELKKIEDSMLPSINNPTRAWLIAYMFNGMFTKLYNSTNRYYYNNVEVFKLPCVTETRTIPPGHRTRIMQHKLFKKLVRQGVIIEHYNYGTNVPKGSYTDTFKLNHDHKIVKKFIKNVFDKPFKYGHAIHKGYIQTSELRGMK